MTEYIERDTAIKRIKEYALSVFGIDLDNSQEYAGRSLPENYCEGLYEATELTDDLPAADVAPVRHGRWIDAYPDIEPNPMFMYGICSECGFEQGISKYLSYCPNCGAKMDGGDGNSDMV